MPSYGAYDDPTVTISELDRRLKAKHEERARLNRAKGGTPQASKNRRRRKGGKR